MDSTSASLLFRLRNEDATNAWPRFVEIYTPLLMRWCMRLRMPEADAADFTQEVLLQMIRNLRTFQYDSSRSFRAWLKTVLMNHWRKHLRKLSREPAKSGDADAIPDSDPGQFVDDAEHGDFLVRRAFQIAERDFEPNTWKACCEFVMKGRPAQEVAEELGLSVNAVYLAKSRVLRHLRTELAGLLD